MVLPYYVRLFSRMCFRSPSSSRRKKDFQNHEHENENAETMMGWKTRKITTCINLAYPRRFVDETHCCPDKPF